MNPFDFFVRVLLFLVGTPLFLLGFIVASIYDEVTPPHYGSALRKLDDLVEWINVRVGGYL